MHAADSVKPGEAAMMEVGVLPSSTGVRTGHRVLAAVKKDLEVSEYAIKETEVGEEAHPIAHSS